MEKILMGNKPQVERYIAGNEKIFGFLVGEAMKAMKGKANPRIVNEILKKKIETLRVTKL